MTRESVSMDPTTHRQSAHHVVLGAPGWNQPKASQQMDPQRPSKASLWPPPLLLDPKIWGKTELNGLLFTQMQMTLMRVSREPKCLPTKAAHFLRVSLGLGWIEWKTGIPHKQRAFRETNHNSLTSRSARTRAACVWSRFHLKSGLSCLFICFECQQISEAKPVNGGWTLSFFVSFVFILVARLVTPQDVNATSPQHSKHRLSWSSCMCVHVFAVNVSPPMIARHQPKAVD